MGSYVSDSKGATPDDTSLQPYLGKLGKEHDSVPRKRNKFISYAKRSLKIEEDDVADRLFDFIEKRVKAEEEREVCLIETITKHMIALMIGKHIHFIYNVKCIY